MTGYTQTLFPSSMELASIRISFVTLKFLWMKKKIQRDNFPPKKTTLIS